jgi:ketosteroid isomerase-like protein
VDSLGLPEDTPPSEAVAKMDDAGFQAAAGDQLRPKGGGAPVFVDAARFDSADGASEAQDYLHSQDLQQPCAGACVVSPQEFTIDGIPGATAVHQVPIDGPLPPGKQPFEGYSVEFTNGSDLFYVTASGDPGDIPPRVFEKAPSTSTSTPANTSSRRGLVQACDRREILRTDVARPSRPPGCGIRRCRRRTSRSCASTNGNGTAESDSLEFPSDVVTEGDRVIVRVAWRGVGRGPHSDIEWTNVFTIRDGRIVDAEYFWEHAAALEAAEPSK